MDMVTKKELAEVEKMTSAKISEYLSDITQTTICRDKNYCDKLIKIYLSKPFKNEA